MRFETVFWLDISFALTFSLYLSSRICPTKKVKQLICRCLKFYATRIIEQQKSRVSFFFGEQKIMRKLKIERKRAIKMDEILKFWTTTWTDGCMRSWEWKNRSGIDFDTFFARFHEKFMLLLFFFPSQWWCRRQSFQKWT